MESKEENGSVRKAVVVEVVREAQSGV